MKYITIVFLLLFLIGCKSDSVDVNPAHLQGKWTILTASKNNKPTKMLDRSSISFNQDNTVEANFLPAQLVYKISNDSILMGDSKKFHFKVNHLCQDTLKLQRDHRKVRLQMNFLKQ